MRIRLTKNERDEWRAEAKQSPRDFREVAYGITLHLLDECDALESEALTNLVRAEKAEKELNDVRAAINDIRDIYSEYLRGDFDIEDAFSAMINTADAEYRRRNYRTSDG